MKTRHIGVSRENMPTKSELISSWTPAVMVEIMKWAIPSEKIIFSPNLVPDGNKYSKEQRDKANLDEKTWGNNIIGECQGKNGNWTTKLGECLVFKTLQERGLNPRYPQKIEGFEPDIETDNAIWEVKSRSWTTSGTAGEKIMGTPFKYASIPRLYSKPLNIVCVAYQEHEARQWGLFGDDGSTPERTAQIQFWKSQQINFVPFSSI